MNKAAKSGVYQEHAAQFVEFLIFNKLFNWEDGADSKPGRAVRLEDGEPSDITLERAFKEILPEKFGIFFDSGIKGGSGAQGSTGKALPRKPSKRSEMTSADKAAFITTHGREKYMALPA